MAKINVRNIALILGVTIFNISAGFYDRFINGAGIIKLIAGIGIHTDSPYFQSNIFTATPDLSSITMVNSMTSTGTAINFLALGIFIIFAVIIIGLITTTLGMGGRA